MRRCGAELAQDIGDGHRWLLRLATTRGEPLTLRLEELTAAPLLGGGGGATDALGVAAAAARDDGGPLGGVAGTLNGCGEVVGKLLDRVATLRRLCDARDASLDAKEATLNAREAELGVEVERREGEAGLLADFLPLLERKRERLAELEQEVSTVPLRALRAYRVHYGRRRRVARENQLDLASRWYAASSSSSPVSPEST